MPSPLQIITNALMDLNVTGAGQSSPSGEDTELALSHYNRAVGDLVARGLGWYEVNEVFPFAVSQQSYQLAPVGTTPASGVFVMTAAGVRPPKIDRAKLVLTSSSGHYGSAVRKHRSAGAIFAVTSSALLPADISERHTLARSISHRHHESIAPVLEKPACGSRHCRHRNRYSYAARSRWRFNGRPCAALRWSVWKNAHG
jgi:hypothetical protein